MKNIVYFDLETQKSADEVGGWGRIRDMRMSVSVTYSTARGDYRIYGERQVNELRLRKDALDPAQYEQQLEKLVTDLALKTRQIRDFEGKK